MVTDWTADEAHDRRIPPWSARVRAAWRMALGCLVVGGALGCSRPEPTAKPPPEKAPAATAQEPGERPETAREPRLAESEASHLRRPDAPVPPVDHDIDFFRLGDALAKQERYADALEAWKNGYLRSLPKLRGLPLRHPVEARFMRRPQLEAKVLEELAKEKPKAQADAESLTYTLLGFVEPGFDLLQTFTQMLTEEIAGFYDPDTKELFLISDHDAPRPAKGLLDLFRPKFDPDLQKGILAHELAHALDDQHFDLLSLQRSVKDDDDMALALQGLVEGEAMITMLPAIMGPLLGPEVLDIDLEAFDTILRLAMSFAAVFAGGDAFGKAPLILRESLLFPYLAGMKFCLTLYQDGHGFARVHAAFRRLPTSTEQILHPVKWFQLDPEPPLAVAWAKDGPLDAPAWELVRDNTLGELQLEIWLRPHVGEDVSRVAAAGWGGDRYRVVRQQGDPTRQLAAVHTVWDTENDAREFFDAASKAKLALKAGRWIEVIRAQRAVFILASTVPLPSFDVAALVTWLREATVAPKQLTRVQATPSKPFGTPLPGSELPKVERPAADPRPRPLP